jgi:hypothetical protein
MIKRFLIIVIYFLLVIPVIVLGATNLGTISENVEGKNKMKLGVEITDRIIHSYLLFLRNFYVSCNIHHHIKN